MLQCFAQHHGSFFFFQAEDGIRDYKVTGVQTCALPISAVARLFGLGVQGLAHHLGDRLALRADRKSTRLNSSHLVISYAVFCLKKKKTTTSTQIWSANTSPASPTASPGGVAPQTISTRR